MMALNWSQKQIDACAIFNATGNGSKLIDIADMLARLDDGQFEMVLIAFQAYRQSFILQKGIEPQPSEPRRRRPRPRRRAPLWDE